MAFRRGDPQFFVSTCFLWLWLSGSLALAQIPSASVPGPLLVHGDFPGGNIRVEEIKGDGVWLQQDLRNASQPWFYWMFSVKGAQGRNIDFHFADSDVFGRRGPAASCDGGRNWFWLGAEACQGRSFRYTFAPHEEAVQFGAVIPYVQKDLDLFLARYETNDALRIGTLGHTPKGRPVEWLRAGRVDGQAPYRMLVTCRHYASETMASFAVEGLLTEVLGTNESGAWFRENVEVCLAPLLDKDGVEEGHQGRWRHPYEFWLDYGSDSRYTAARSLRARFDPTNGPAVQITLDLQCPSLRDDALHLASSANPLHPPLATNVARFSELLEQRQQGPLVYRRANNQLIAPHAPRTNEYGELRSFLQWAEALPGSEVVAVVELPFASVGTAEVTPDSARAFGQDLARAARAYLGGRVDPALTGRARPPRPYRRPAIPEPARRPQTNAPAIQAPAPAAKHATNATNNTWNRLVGSNTLSGSPWHRHAIDKSSAGADGVKLADVNGDGRLDIVTGWEEGGEVRLYLHPGGDRCREPWPRVLLGKVRSPEDAVLADLDGDGRWDALSATEGNEQTVFVHWSAPGTDLRLNSSWETQPIPITRGQQMWMFLVPVQLDGRNGLDVVTGSKGEHGAIGWLQAPMRARDSAGWRWFPLRKAGWVMSLRALDMDGDADPDILFSDRKGPASAVGWLENPGPTATLTNAPWPEHVLGARGREVMFVDAGQLDTNGAMAVVAAVKPSDILLLRRQGTNQWAEDWIHLKTNCGNAKGVKLADLNGDGRMDLVFSCEGALGERRGVIWLRREEQGWHLFDLSGAAGVKFDLIETLDIDGDGDLDVLTCEETENLGVIWYENPSRWPGVLPD